jgi:hypothetical protein
MKITKTQLKQIIKEELEASMVKESEDEGMGPDFKENFSKFLDDNHVDSPMGLTPAQEEAYVDALRKAFIDAYTEIFERFYDQAEANEYNDYLDED